jgi:hypothetical protein
VAIEIVPAFPLAVSDLAIAGISAGAALLGALVGGGVTYKVEQSRQKHERDLEQERYERQQEERERQDLAVARGLARVMFNDFLLAHLALQSERDQDKWSDSPAWKPRLGAEDRRDLFRYLRRDEFLSVMGAEGFLEQAEGSRRDALDFLEKMDAIGAAEEAKEEARPSNVAQFPSIIESTRKAQNALDWRLPRRKLPQDEPAPLAPWGLSARMIPRLVVHGVHGVCASN